MLARLEEWCLVLENGVGKSQPNFQIMELAASNWQLAVEKARDELTDKTTGNSEIESIFTDRSGMSKWKLHPVRIANNSTGNSQDAVNLSIIGHLSEGNTIDLLYLIKAARSDDGDKFLWSIFVDYDLEEDDFCTTNVLKIGAQNLIEAINKYNLLEVVLNHECPHLSLSERESTNLSKKRESRSHSIFHHEQREKDDKKAEFLFVRTKA